MIVLMHMSGEAQTCMPRKVPKLNSTTDLFLRTVLDSLKLVTTIFPTRYHTPLCSFGPVLTKLTNVSPCCQYMYLSLGSTPRVIRVRRRRNNRLIRILPRIRSKQCMTKFSKANKTTRAHPSALMIMLPLQFLRELGHKNR